MARAMAHLSSAMISFILCVHLLPGLANVLKEVDVAIVGAGYSGLSAARVLKRHGVSFHVLEARERVGGRILNQEVVGQKPDDVVEMGGEWLATGHHEALRLFKELGFEFFHRPFNTLGGASNATVPPCRGACAVRVRSEDGWHSVSSPDAAVKLFPQEERQALQKAQDEMSKEVRNTPCHAPFSNPNASLWDSLSYDAFLKMVLGLQHFPMAYNTLYAYADDAEALNQISALFVLWQLNCSDGVEGSGGEDFWRVRGGSQAPAIRMAAQLGEDLQLGAHVTAIHRRDNSLYEVHSSKGVVVAKHVIVAGLTPSLITAIDFQPPLDGAMDQLLERMPVGTTMKYSMVYEKPWWRERGYLGKMIFLNTSAPSNYVHNCFDNSPYSWSRGVLTCFTEGAQNRAFLRLTDSQQKAVMQNILAEALGPSEEKMVEVLSKNWADDEFARGGYNIFFPPGVLSSFWPAAQRIYEQRQLGPPGLWISGGDYSLPCLGYMNGAIQTGEETAMKIIRELPSRMIV
mmetsp:Transcript_28535/g.40125  ORF Transcript_28535/g.40125 Transcript_28535/m.40125 type:complete len:516 (-) Transcript_28535:86-1633(-)